MKTLDDAHGHFVSCIRWAPGVIKGPVVSTNGDGTNGTVGGVGKKDDPGGGGGGAGSVTETIRCVIATGNVDMNVRVFAS